MEFNRSRRVPNKMNNIFNESLDEVKKHLQPHERCAFLSTPSIYYAFSPEERQEYNLFDVSDHYNDYVRTSTGFY